MTADPLAGDYDDKFELATCSNPRVRRSGSPLLRFFFFKTVFFVLSEGTPNVEQIKQLLYDGHLFWKIVCLRIYVPVNNFSVILGRLPGFNQY